MLPWADPRNEGPSPYAALPRSEPSRARSWPPSVQHSHVRPTRPGTGLRLDLMVALTLTGNLCDILNTLQTGPIQHVRASTGRPHLPVEIRFAIASHRARRTR